jgi:hypothetical protein
VATVSAMSAQVEELVLSDFHDIGSGHALVRVRLTGTGGAQWADLWAGAVLGAKRHPGQKLILESSEPELKIHQGKIALEYKTSDAARAIDVFKIIRDVLVPDVNQVFDEQTARKAESARLAEERANQGKTNFEAIRTAVIEESKRLPGPRASRS